MLAPLRALVIGAAGCSDPSADSATTTATRTATPTATATPTPTLEPDATEAIAAVEAFWAIVDDLGINPDKRLDELATVARAQSVDDWSTALTNRRASFGLQVGESIVRNRDRWPIRRSRRFGCGRWTSGSCRRTGTVRSGWWGCRC
jgi:hypothetical protein